MVPTWLPPVAVDEMDDDVPPAPEAEATDDELDLDDLVRLLRWHPPPTGMFRSAPPRVQYHQGSFDCGYNAIIGRPGLVKFMAIPHYSYMILKMSGPQGIIEST